MGVIVRKSEGVQEKLPSRASCASPCPSPVSTLCSPIFLTPYSSVRACLLANSNSLDHRIVTLERSNEPDRKAAHNNPVTHLHKSCCLKRGDDPPGMNIEMIQTRSHKNENKHVEQQHIHWYLNSVTKYSLGTNKANCVSFFNTSTNNKREPTTIYTSPRKINFSRVGIKPCLVTERQDLVCQNSIENRSQMFRLHNIHHEGVAVVSIRQIVPLLWVLRTLLHFSAFGAVNAIWFNITVLYLHNTEPMDPLPILEGTGQKMTLKTDTKQTTHYKLPSLTINLQSTRNTCRKTLTKVVLISKSVTHFFRQMQSHQLSVHQCDWGGLYPQQ